MGPNAGSEQVRREAVGTDLTLCARKCCFHPNPTRERGISSPSFMVFEFAIFEGLKGLICVPFKLSIRVGISILPSLCTILL